MDGIEEAIQEVTAGEGKEHAGQPGQQPGGDSTPQEGQPQGGQSVGGQQHPSPDSTGNAGTPPPQPGDDPELELGLGPDGKVRLVKRSQILDWEKGQLRQQDYTRKTKELAAQREELNEMYQILDTLKRYPKEAEKIIGILNGIGNAPQLPGAQPNQPGQPDAMQAQVDELLKDLPEDDPYAKMIRLLHQQNQALQGNLQQITGKFSAFEQSSQQVNEGKMVEQAQNLLNSSIEDVSKTLQFADDNDKGLWRTLVLQHLLATKQEYENFNEQEFVEYLGGVCKDVFEKLHTLGEKAVKRYIETKRSGIHVQAPGGAEGGATPKPLDSANLQENLENALQSEAEKQGS